MTELTRETATVRGTPRDRFIRLATTRVNAALKAIQLIGNLGNRTNYDYDEKAIAKIFKALQTEIDAAKAKFAASANGKQHGGFSL